VIGRLRVIEKRQSGLERIPIEIARSFQSNFSILESGFPGPRPGVYGHLPLWSAKKKTKLPCGPQESANTAP